VTFGTNCGGSIVGITPGIALSSVGGGSIVGITPGKSHKKVVMDLTNTLFLGAALEKKSVRELAAGLNRMGK